VASPFVASWSDIVWLMGGYPPSVNAEQCDRESPSGSFDNLQMLLSYEKDAKMGG